MAKSIDQRVVAMGFENATFEKAVDQTLKTLAKLDAALANLGKTSGLKNIEVEASKITLKGPMTALDKLKSKFNFTEARNAFGSLETASSRLSFRAPNFALDRFKEKLTFRDAASGFLKLEAAAAKVTFRGLMKALDLVKSKIAFPTAKLAFNGLQAAANSISFGGLQRTISRAQAMFRFPGAGKAFADIERQSSQVKFAPISSAIDQISNKFSVMEGAASVALGNIGTMIATKVGAKLKEISFGPLSDGFEEYSTNLNSIQVILANTAAAGTTIKDVNKALQELNEYSDQTIYNFGQMAENIGKFTSAGVDLDTSVASIKGLSNVAALSGANAEKASHAMYQLSQAISAGVIGVEDWNSVVQSDMGGAQFQKALAETAVATGKLSRDAVSYEGSMKNLKINGESFRKSIMSLPGAPPSWLSSDVLTNTLKILTGDMTDAQVAAMGFSKEQVKAIQLTARNAKLAATEVKTIKGVWDVAKESIGSGWAQTWQIIFGDFEVAKKTFTNLSQFLGGFINKQADARNEMLETWSELGGRKNLIEGFKSTFDGLLSVLKPIQVAFREIFPKTTGKDLAEFTKQFKDLMDKFRLGEKSSDELFRVFRGLFSLLHIGVTVFKEIVRLIGSFFKAVAEDSGGFTNFVAILGDMVYAIDQALTKGGALRAWFDSLTGILSLPLKILKAIGSAVAALFDGSDTSASEAFSKSLGSLGDKMGPIQKTVDLFVDGWHKLVDVFNSLKEAVEPGLQKVFEQIDSFADMVADSFENANWDRVFEVLETTFIGGIFIAIKKALANGFGVTVGGDVMDSVSETLKAMTTNLVAIQNNVRANTLLQIAAAVLLLAVGIQKIAAIDPGALSKAMTAIAVGLGELIASVFLLAKVGGGWKAVAGLGPLALTMVAIALSIVVLSEAVENFGEMDWDDLIKGLGGVLFALVALGTGVKAIEPKGLMAVALALIPMGIALNIIAVAVRQFSTMDWEELAKGLGGLMGSLVAIGGAMWAFPPTMAVTAASLILVGFALSFIAGAVGSFGNMDLSTLAKGIIAMGLALAVIGGAMWAFPPPPLMLASAAALVLTSIALGGIAAAVAVLGNLSLKSLAKGIGAIAAIMFVFAESLYMMVGALPGAAALVVAAIALNLMVPVIAALGLMKWGTVLKGLGMLALILTTLGIFGLVAAPAMLALGIALIPVGIAMLLVAFAAKKMAEAFVLLGTTGEAGIAAAVAAIGSLVYLMPRLLIDFAKGVISVLDSLTKLLPKIIQALGLAILSMLDGIIQIAPKLLVAVGKIMDAVLEFMKTYWPKLVEAGILFLKGFLEGIKRHTGEITNTSIDIIESFLKAIRERMPDLAKSGRDTLVTWLEELKKHIPDIAKAASEVMAQFIEEVGKHGERMIDAAGEMMGYLLGGIVDFYPNVIETAAEVVTKFIDGFSVKGPELARKAVTAAGKFINALSDELVRLHDIASQAMVDFINGLADSIREHNQDLVDAGWNLADALLSGLQAGVDSIGPRVVAKLGKLVRLLPRRAREALGIHSPSRVFSEIGKNMMYGLEVGIKKESYTVEEALQTVTNDSIKSFKEMWGIRSPSTVMRDLGQQVTQGFADGIKGNEDDILNAFSELNQKIGDAVRTSRENIASEQERLDELLAEKKPDMKAIAESRKILADNESILRRSLEARRMLTKQLADEKGELIKLADELEDVTAKLEKAQEDLKTITDEKNSFVTSTKDQYGTLPDVEPDTTLEDYKKSIAERALAVQRYSLTLQKLRAMKLDDITYKMLLAKGTEGQEFADQLLAGGQTAVDSVNVVDKSLENASLDLANHAAEALYQAGIDAAQGLVNGLTAKKADLEKAAGDLADAIVKAMKNKLKMKSPSKVFEEIGIFSGKGLANGLDNSTSLVVAAATGLGSEAMSALQDTMSGISEAVDTNIDMDPTITPVLDLTQLTKDAQKLNDLTNVVPITAAASYGQALAISAERNSADQAAADAAEQMAPSFTYEQTINSPDPISAIEIYRQTNNSLGKLSRFFNMSAPR